MWTLAALAALTCAVVESLVQNEPNSSSRQEDVVLTELSKPVYPRLAKQARVQGDVVLKVVVRRDGTVEVAEAISGPAMLIQATLDSAKNSRFDCSSCTETLTLFRMVYTFETVSPEFDANCEAKPDATYPLVSQSRNHVTVIDQSIGICDPIETIAKVRSVKCLYLWKCGHR